MRHPGYPLGNGLSQRLDLGAVGIVEYQDPAANTGPPRSGGRGRRGLVHALHHSDGGPHGGMYRAKIRESPHLVEGVTKGLLLTEWSAVPNASEVSRLSRRGGVRSAVPLCPGHRGADLDD